MEGNWYYGLLMPVFPHRWLPKTFCCFFNSHRFVEQPPPPFKVRDHWPRTDCVPSTAQSPGHPPSQSGITNRFCWKSSGGHLSQWDSRLQCGSHAFLGIASLPWFLLMEKIISLTRTLHLAANPGPRVAETCIYFKATGVPRFSFWL